MGKESELSAAFAGLLSVRGLAIPDGRPLHAYHFTKDEVEDVAGLLRSCGPTALYRSAGQALILAHVAEWFRRERAGGRWDWIRPLGSIGLRYGPGQPVQYSDVEELVRGGLHAWRRPQPRGGERLLAVVAESGFPVAAVRDDPRISSWLRHAVLCAERGFGIRQAVSAEAWRVSDRLAQALFESAVELCDAIVDLRAGIPEEAREGDPVSYLDAARPRWRETLPFDVEQIDVRTLVERLVRFRDCHGSALDVERKYVRNAAGEWRPRASIALEGELDLRRVPGVVASALAEGRRLRIFARPPLARDLVAIAALESREGDGDADRINEVRTFVAAFEVDLALEDEARLLAQSGQSTIGEFVPAGGQVIDGPVVALDVAEVDEEERPRVLRVIGTSSCQSSKASLVLAIQDDVFRSVDFSETPTELGTCARSGRRLVLFSGTAVLERDGVRWRWHTSADRNVDSRPILIGNLLPGVRETVFCGLPSLWTESDGHVVAPRQGTLHWRPRGRGHWRPIANGTALGAIELAVIDEGEVRHSVGLDVVPAATRIEFDRVARTLRLPGLDAPMVGASAVRPFQVRTEAGVPIVELGPPSGAPIVVVRARWDSEITLTMADPSYELRLIDEQDRLVATRAVFALDDLGGRRIMALREALLCMELRAPGSPRVVVSRPVTGEVPLSALRDTIHQLLGRSTSLDATVVLSTLGSNECIAEVKWYCEDVDPFAAPARGGAFAALAALHPLDLKGVSLVVPEGGALPFTGPARQEDVRAELEPALPQGPWLVFGRRRSGEIIRPRIIPAGQRSHPGATALVRAMQTDAADARTRAFTSAYSDPGAFAEEDLRRLVALLVLARREYLPASSIDALCALRDAPGLAIRLLAHCDEVDERAAVLDLQRDLPFLWCATSIASWLAEFAARFDAMRTTLARVGVPFDMTRHASRVLREITGVRPELAGHARAVFVATAAAEAKASAAVDGSAGDFSCQLENLHVRSEIDRLVTRHPDRDPPPHGILSQTSMSAFRQIWEPYASEFAEVIAAPFAVAEQAAGMRRLVPDELAGCRDAALYDPEYFEAVVPMRTNGMLNRILQNGAAA